MHKLNVIYVSYYLYYKLCRGVVYIQPTFDVDDVSQERSMLTLLAMFSHFIYIIFFHRKMFSLDAVVKNDDEYLTL